MINKNILNYKIPLLVLIIPIINALATNSTNYFPAGSLNPGTIRAFLIGAYAVYFILSDYPTTKLNIFILSYLTFYLVLVFFSTNISLSFYIYLKFFLGVIMFPIGYKYFNTTEKLKKLSYVLLLSLIIFIINILLSNIFKLGTSDYLKDSFYFGAGRVNITKTMLTLTLIAPVSLFLFKNTRFFRLSQIVFFIGLLISIIGIKRSVLISILSGGFIYSFLKKHKTNLIKITIGLFLIFSLSSFFFTEYINLFLKRFEAREERIQIDEETFDEEARYSETLLVWSTWKNGNVFHKLFGSELFNDREFFQSRRMLHTDYMIALNGSGMIGFILWFYLFWRIVKEKNKYYRHLKNIYFFQELNAVFYMILAAQLIMSISGTIYDIDLRSVIFLYFGATISVMRTAAINQLANTPIYG